MDGHGVGARANNRRGCAPPHWRELLSSGPARLAQLAQLAPASSTADAGRGDGTRGSLPSLGRAGTTPVTHLASGNTGPDHRAAEYARALLASRAETRLGLVAAASGAEALTAVGWAGPCDYDNDTAKFSAVVRDWGHRFGARVMAIGFSTLRLSVATSPVGEHEAPLVAAEHFAFCPDDIRQGGRPHTLAACAKRITGTRRWDFWWD
ncbi:DUF4253 domain-containing protein [Streptomyces nondiastaticus]|uniref:DUF4253 domain-containing protein n=1 Tax=Streptomyces nondiastaticus TaxID=3154512 RepID=A0ABW6U311_9ACTN